MKRLSALAIPYFGLSIPSFAEDRRWSFDKTPGSGFSVLGDEVAGVSGIREASLDVRR